MSGPLTSHSHLYDFSSKIPSELRKPEGLCLHCVMVEMGDMVCYQQFCPNCGRVPPGRMKYKKLYRNLLMEKDIRQTEKFKTTVKG